MKKLMTAGLAVCPKVRARPQTCARLTCGAGTALSARRSRTGGTGRRNGALFRDRVQLCSGLVDLVVGVGRHGGGGHRLTLAGERFVGLVAEDVAEVGDRRVDFTDGRRAEGIDGETGDDRRRFVASEPVQQGGEDSQRDVDRTVLPASSKLRIPTMP
jgi:hypothetical protein